jgi:hypothetical protein
MVNAHTLLSSDIAIAMRSYLLIAIVFVLLGQHGVNARKGGGGGGNGGGGSRGGGGKGGGGGGARGGGGGKGIDDLHMYKDCCAH